MRNDTEPRSRLLESATWLAAGLGLASAAVSAYWASGGTALLDTFGGQIESVGRRHGPWVVIGLAAIALIKTVVALAAPVFAGAGQGWLPRSATGQSSRAMGWAAASVLTAYGGYLTIGGLLVKGGAIVIAGNGASKAFTWHVYLWDPWFLIWGLSLGLCLWLTRAQHNLRAKGRMTQ